MSALRHILSVLSNSPPKLISLNDSRCDQNYVIYVISLKSRGILTARFEDHFLVQNRPTLDRLKNRQLSLQTSQTLETSILSDKDLN